jgi:hypothetical protein
MLLLFFVTVTTTLTAVSGTPASTSNTSRGGGRNDYQQSNNEFMSAVLANLLPIVIDATAKVVTRSLQQLRPWKGRRKGSTTVKRTRRPAEDLFSELSDHGFRRMYRMSRDSFWKLYDILEPNMPQKRKRKRGRTPNGDVTNATRLAMALRYFSGGDPQDIGHTHGVNNNAVVMQSVWYVVDAVNTTKQLDIRFPTSHEEQQKIALGFKAKSRIGLDNCVGAIDGILIWIHKPSKVDLSENIGFGPKKFFCGRKKKFGLSMMGTCDSKGLFLDVEIKFPGATSDFYAFLNSDFRMKLESDGFLAEGLSLYGDNAYVNSPYMIVPFKGAQNGAKDAFNFYHSSLRINIECAFGMMVHRWGILRKAIPMNITVQKTTSLVFCLCKLHNYCISERENIARPDPKDVMNIRMEGGFSLSRFDNDDTWTFNAAVDRVDELMDGGEHFDDVNRRNIGTSSSPISESVLPNIKMLEFIESKGYQRPSY